MARVVHAFHDGTVRHLVCVTGHFRVVHALHDSAIRHFVGPDGHHLGVVHFTIRHHGTVIHTLMRHAHIRHGKKGWFTHFWHFGRHPLARRQCAPCEGRAAHGFGEDGIGLVLCWPDDDVISFSNGDPKLINRDRLDIVSIGLHNRHFQTGDTDVKIGHRRGIDEPQADPFARLEQSGPVRRRALAVDQRGEALEILDIGRHHPHLAPGLVVGHGGAETLGLGIFQKIEQGPLLAIVVIWHRLQVAHDPVAGMRVRVGELDHVFLVVTKRLAALLVDDDRAVGTIWFLKAGVAVKPISTALGDRERVGKGLARRDAVIANARHPVLLERQDQPVPMHRGWLGEIVGHVDRDILAFLEAQNWPR